MGVLIVIVLTILGLGWFLWGMVETVGDGIFVVVMSTLMGLFIGMFINIGIVHVFAEFEPKQEVYSYERLIHKGDKYKLIVQDDVIEYDTDEVVIIEGADTNVVIKNCMTVKDTVYWSLDTYNYNETILIKVK